MEELISRSARRREFLQHVRGVRERAVNEQQRAARKGPARVRLQLERSRRSLLEAPEARLECVVDRGVQPAIDRTDRGDHFVWRQHGELTRKH